MNIGHSSRLVYDDCYYNDHLSESTSPLSYRLNSNNIANCNACLSTLGPRSGFKGYGVSTVSDNGNLSPAEDLVDLESILSNRNVQQSKCRTAHVNNIDVTKFKVNNAKLCDEFLDTVSSRLSYPASNYRSMAINRFYDLPKNAQAPLFWDFSTNTRLEAKDNYMIDVPEIKNYDPSMPISQKGKLVCTSNCGSVCAAGCQVV